MVRDVRLIFANGDRFFTEAEATEILNSPLKDSWKLPSDSNYEMTKDGIKRRAIKDNNRGKAESKPAE